MNKFKLSTKLISAFIALAIFGGLLVGIVSVVNISNINKLSQQIYSENMVPLKPVYKAEIDYLKVRINLRDMALSKEADKSKYVNNIDSLYKDINIQLDEYAKNISSDEERKNYQEIKEMVDSYGTVKDKVKDFILANQLDNAMTLMNGQANDLAKTVDTDINNAFDINTNQAKDRNDSNTKTGNNAILIMVGIVLLSVILSTVIGVFMSRSISKPMIWGMQNLTESAQQVASASEQLSSSSQMLAQSNSEQASSIEETSATLEESSSMIRQNSENTKQAEQLAAQTKSSADRGNNEMREMMNSMKEIKKSSDQIAKIIKVIDDIAFQTNILALNAAVEAARAGDAGMGFAVVAEEVRNLAQRSAQAAKDTAAMIETNIELSEKGVEVSNRVAEALSDITIQAKKVNELMDEISAASQEQTQGIGQINKAMSQMEKATQQNAATAEESAAASEQLSAQAQTVNEIVQQLMALVMGSAHQTGMYIKNKEYAQMKPSNHLQTLPMKKSTVSPHNHSISEKMNVKTHIVNPDDVIPLSKESDDF